MSVLGHKITDLKTLNSLQPGDTFLAIRGGISYRINGDRFATYEQLTFNKNDYTTKINTIKQTVDSSLLRINTNVSLISADVKQNYFLKTDGNDLSFAMEALSSIITQDKAKIDRIDATYVPQSFVVSTSANIITYTTDTFLTKVSALQTFIPLPGPQYVKTNGDVLTWNSAISAWTPGLGAASNIDLGPIGTIIMHAGTTPPFSYLLCNGQAVKKTDYPDLWDTIGDTYGRPVGTAEDEFRLPNLLDMGIITQERSNGPSVIPTIFCIKATTSYRTALTQELSGYVKLASQPITIPNEEQYLKYYNGEWVASTLPTTSALPTTAPLSSILMWNGTEWSPGTSQLQTIYNHQAVTIFNNSSCVFANIPVTAKKITIVISGLDITPNNGTFVKLRLGNNNTYVNSGYQNACYGIYNNTYIRTSNGYYSYTTNTGSDTDACYLLVRGETLESRETFGGLDTVITFMRSQLSVVNNSSKWVYTHTGRIGASVVHGAGSVMIPTPVPDVIGIFSPNPSALLTTGNLTLYWE